MSDPKEEISVLVDDKLVDYVLKRPMADEISRLRIEVAGMKVAVSTAKTNQRKAEDRYGAVCMATSRALSKGSPAENGWTISVAADEMDELRALTELVDVKRSVA